jgi:hypothetical protein
MLSSIAETFNPIDSTSGGGFQVRGFGLGFVNDTDWVNRRGWQAAPPAPPLPARPVSTLLVTNWRRGALGNRRRWKQICRTL